MKNLKICFFYILWFICIPLSAQPFTNITNYDNNQHGINNNVRHIIQDKTGLIWFSTYDGLYKFDGTTFTCYKATIENNFPLISNHIEQLCENSNKDIWCLVKNKPYLFKRPQNIFLQPEAIKNDTIFGYWNIDHIYNLSGKTIFTNRKGGVFFVNDNDHSHTPHLLIQESTSISPIHQITTDKNGSLWIFYRDKTIIIHSNSFSTFNHGFLQTTEIANCHWLFSMNGEIAYTDTHYSLPQFIPNPYQIHRINSFVKHKEKFIYLATNQGIVLLNTQNREQQIIQIPISNVEPQKLFIDSHNHLWVSTNHSLIFKIDLITYQTETINIQLTSTQATPAIHSFIEDTFCDNIWICNDTHTDFWFYSKDKGFFVHEKNKILQSTLRSRFLDRDGNLWLGSYEGLKLITFHENKFHNTSINEEVLCIFKERNGNIWYSTREGYIRIHDSHLNLLGYLNENGEITSSKTKFNRLVFQIIEDRHSNIWIAARGNGLLLLKKEKNNKYHIQTFQYNENDPYSINESNVYTLMEDSYGHIWVGGLDGGINLISQAENGEYIFINTRNQWTHLKDKEPRSIRCFLQIYPSTMLVGCDAGLYTFNCQFDSTNNIKFFHNHRNENIKHSLSNNVVLCLLHSTTGEIYVGTSGGGLCKIISDNLLSDTIHFKTMTQIKDGLPSDIIYALAEDHNQKIWAFCDNNLFCIPTDKTTIESYINYLNPNHYRFTLGNSIQVNNNYLLKGYSHGLFTFDPLHIFKKQNIPSLYISSISPIGKQKSSDNEPTYDMTFPPSERNLSINYSVLDYQRNTPINYAYRLVGFDDTWKYHTNERTINYMNLPAGKYIFEVRSTNGDGVWVENTQKIKLNIIPTFWETKWAWVVYLFISILTFCTIFYIYQRFYMLRHKLKLEQAMTETKLNFFTDISHEIRTPLTLIDGPVDEVLRDKELSNESREYLLVVQKNVRHILNLIHHILDFKRIESQQNRLALEPLNPYQELENIMNHFASIAKEKNITFNLISQSKKCTLWADKEKFERIFFNLLSNAFKYTENGKKITVTLTNEDKYITVSVADEGCGIEKKRIPELFKRFETIAKDNLFKPSSGLGLAMVKSLADAHQATIQVESEPHKGSCFNIRFKEGFKHFEKNKNVEITQENAIVHQETIIDLTENKLPSILIVEDNNELRLFVKQILGTQYQVIEATNGKEGLEMARLHWPDLIISDVMMPEMDGFNMIKSLKNDPDIYLIPIILLTAKSTIDDKIKGAELGVDDYIIKPFSTTYLRTKVDALLKQRELLHTQILNEAQQKGVSFQLPTSILQEKINSTDTLFVQNLMKFIEENISNSTMVIEDIASTFNMSRSLFNRKVKAILGCTPIDLVINKRIKYALLLLDTTDYNISEIAYRAGFNDPRYFSRIFKKITGKTPKQYQQDKHKS